MSRLLNIRDPRPCACHAVVTLLLLASFLFSVAPAAVARVPARGTGGAAISGPLASQFAISDFDGDSRPDLASVHVGQSGPRETRYSIDFQLTSGLSQRFDFIAPIGGLALASEDVNGDTFPDLVVTAYWTRQPVAILLNDGRGNFTPAQPAAFPQAFSFNESFAVCRGVFITDSAALASRDLSSGYCERLERLAAPASQSLLSASTNSQFRLFTASAAWLGRAPPHQPIHV